MSDGQIWARLQLFFAQGKATLIGSKKVQGTGLDSGQETEVFPNVERVEPYGFSYRPKPGSQMYVVFPAGDRSHGLALVIGDKRYQLELQEGEVAIHDDEENFVKIEQGGIIRAKAATKVIADTPLFETTNDAKIGGNLVVLGQTQSNGGFVGDEGGAAEMKSGAEVLGTFKVNGKDVGDGHKHTGNGAGAPTSGVI